MTSTKEPVRKMLLSGGAGLVGQNLVLSLKQRGYSHITVLDKHAHNLSLISARHPDVIVREVDLAVPGAWMDDLAHADTVVMLQAQIGAKHRSLFERNTIDTTDLVLEAMRRHSAPHLIHVSSSVVNSVAEDDYTRTKREQEQMVLTSGLANVVLRPTLMFGWFDRKHLGWLARFMRKVPAFPIPGHGRYMRQPLYVRDFCDVIVKCVANRLVGGPYNITGTEQIDYIDIIRTIRDTLGVRTPIVRIPYWLFDGLLRTWALFDSNPPFTTDQLRALVAGDEFDSDDWPEIFGVTPTPFRQAIRETFLDPTYSQVELEF